MTKAEILALVRDEFEQWEQLLAGLSESEITRPIQADEWGVHDIVAHLFAWQQLTIARLEAGTENREPHYPDWFDAEAEEDADRVNAGTFARYHHRPWAEVYSLWKNGYLRFIDLGEAIPDAQLLDKNCYTWLDGYSLGDVMHFSYEHHHVDHLGPLKALLAKRNTSSS